jgi:hypothetical protein
VPAMTPRCPVCNELMKEDGRAFKCKPCRQILIFFPVAEGSALWPVAVALADARQLAAITLTRPLPSHSVHRGG